MENIALCFLAAAVAILGFSTAFLIKRVKALEKWSDSLSEVFKAACDSDSYV